MRDGRPHHAFFPNMPHQRPRRHARNTDDALILQISAEIAAVTPAADNRTKRADNKASRPDARRFGIFEVDAGIADMRHGHSDNLSAVGRIGQNFLVAGHGRIEDDLAGLNPLRAKAFAGENPSIFQSKRGLHVSLF